MTDIETSDLSSVKKSYGSTADFAHDENAQGNGDCVESSLCEKAQHSERASESIIEELNRNVSKAEDEKGMHEDWVMNSQFSEQEKPLQNHSSTIVEKEKHQRIQFKIGKKRKKSLSDGVQSSKRSISVSHPSNVLEDDEEEGTDSDETTTREASISAPMALDSFDSVYVNEGDIKCNTTQQKDSQSDNDSHPSPIGHDVDTITTTTSSKEPIEHVEQIFHSKGEGYKSTNAQSVGVEVGASLDVQGGAQSHAVPRQPDGWRVKLYRLNADGSWDDCGTGRIVFLTHAQKTSHGRVDPITKRKDWDSLGEEIYHILGLPTLCMHAEIPTQSQYQLTGMVNQTPKVLLRTRVLLRESYQRQGDNIITWCEPFFFPTQNKVGQEQSLKRQEHNHHRENTACGVDLALSFQDNAGCRDIWNKISKVQHRAYELFKSRGGLPMERGDDGLQGFAPNQYHYKFHHGEDGKKEDEDIDSNTNAMARSENAANSGNQQEQTNEHVACHKDSNESSNHDQYQSVYDIDEDEHDYSDSDTAAVISMAAKAAQYAGGNQIGLQGKNQGYQNESLDIDDLASMNIHLSNPPNLENLEKIADVIAACQVRFGRVVFERVIDASRVVHHSHLYFDLKPQQREALAMFVSRSECAYLKALIALFPSAEANNNYHALATLASIIKSILLFNEPSIIQLVASEANIFEDCCCCLEYDPDLKEKANHRWFIRNKLRFKTVLLMEVSYDGSEMCRCANNVLTFIFILQDEDLIDSIQKSFRVTYIRDTLLRPTMDESSLSTLGSLLTFTHADVVKGIMCTPRNKNSVSKDSYLVRILRLLGKEIVAIREFEWKIMQQRGRPPGISGKNHSRIAASSNSSQNNTNSNEHVSTPWKQHLVPQDDSLQSRKLRRRGCLSFLREMFNMVRMSLQQSDKDDFYAMIVLMDVSMNDSSNGHDNGVNSTHFSWMGHGDTVNLLSLLGSILSDTNADISERAACLDILSAIAIHEPSLIRKHCLAEYSCSKGTIDDNNDFKKRPSKVIRPEPDDKHQLIFVCPPSDLLLSLLGLMATENDAGIILETCEVIRIILDTEMTNDATQMDFGGVIDNEEDELIGSDNTSYLVGANIQNAHTGGGCELNYFLQIFYDHYVPWLVAPFQYTLLVPKTAIPFSINHGAMNEDENGLQFTKRKHQYLLDHKKSRTGLLKMVSTSAVRLSFSVELLSFCIRAHCYR